MKPTETTKRIVNTGKIQVNVTSVFKGEKTLVERLFALADRKLKNKVIFAKKQQ